MSMTILHIYHGDGFGRKRTVHWNELRVQNEEYPQFAAVAAFQLPKQEAEHEDLAFQKDGFERKRTVHCHLLLKDPQKKYPLQWLGCMDDRVEGVVLCI